MSQFDDPTNDERAEAAAVAVTAYMEVKEPHEDIDESSVTGLLADLMHYCDKNGFNFEACVAMADIHHEAEV